MGKQLSSTYVTSPADPFRPTIIEGPSMRYSLWFPFTPLDPITGKGPSTRLRFGRLAPYSSVQTDSNGTSSK